MDSYFRIFFLAVALLISFKLIKFLLSRPQELDRLEQLQSKLHSYTLFGLPKVPRQLSFHQDSWEEEEEETDLALEDSWQMLLDNPEVQTNKHRLNL